MGMKTLPVNCSYCHIEFQKSISYIKQGQDRGHPNHFCSNKCSRLFNKNHQKELKTLRIEEYYKNPKRCPNCNTPIDYYKKWYKTYCSIKCAALYTQKDGGHCHWTEEKKKKLSDWAKLHAYRTPRRRISKVCLNCNKPFEVQPYKQNQLCCSRKCITEWIVKTGFLKGKNGGFRPNSGTSKKGWYKGYFCGSSWELAWLIYQLEHNVIVERNNTGFEYVFEGKNKKYYPDFYLPSNQEYIEIKGYHSKQVDSKTEQFPHKLTILHKKELSEVFDYVQQKYGKDYINLYEKSS